MAIIEISDLEKTYGKGEGSTYALKGVSLSVEEREMVAIMGKSGSGKSTLLNILGGIVNADSGNYYFAGENVVNNGKRRNIRLRREHIGFIVQHFALIDEINVYQNIELPLKYQKIKNKERKVLVLDMIKKMGLYEKTKKLPTELSGGQKQRVAIGRALVKNPDIILADEPTGALDEATGNRVMNIFEEMHKAGKTIIIVTHDEKIAKRCDRTIRLMDGKIV